MRRKAFLANVVESTGLLERVDIGFSAGEMGVGSVHCRKTVEAFREAISIGKRDGSLDAFVGEVQEDGDDERLV